MISKIHLGIQRFNEVRAGDLKSKMLREGNDQSKRYLSLRKIRGKKVLPSGNTH
jgi:hypothetical protein